MGWEPEPHNTTVVGIDLGTTNSCCYFFIEKTGMEKRMYNQSNNSLIPSVVTYNYNETIVGRMITSKKYTSCRYSKRLLGRNYGDSSVQKLLNSCGASLIDVGGIPCYDLSKYGKGMKKTPEDIATVILDKILSNVKEQSECWISKVCITVPANFDDIQRQLTVNALKRCGIEENMITVISEPCAAAITYLNENQDHLGNVLVFDFGGGTLDSSIVQIMKGGIHVKANYGKNTLGGVDIDKLLAEWILNQLSDHQKKIFEEKKETMYSKLMDLAEISKTNLSCYDSVDISVDSLFHAEEVEEEEEDLSFTLTRVAFNALLQPIVEKVKEVLDHCLRLANLKPDDISDVVFVGGSTRIPCIQEEVRKMFPSTHIRKGADPECAVARGAMLFFQTDLIVDDCTHYSYGHMIIGRKVECIIPKGQKYNTKYTVQNVIGSAVDYIQVRVCQGNAEEEKKKEKVSDCVFIGCYDFYLDSLMEKYGLTKEDIKTRKVETTYEINVSGDITISVHDVETGYVLVDEYKVKS